jgi:hypothetical protein
MTEIVEARELLSQFEQSDEHKERLQKFEEALDLLNSCIEENEGDRVGQVAINLKFTYLRKLIKQLPSLHALDIDDWSEYTLFLLQKVPKETDSICDEDQTMKRNYQNFIDIWSNEFIHLIKKKLPKS